MFANATATTCLCRRVINSHTQALNRSLRRPATRMIPCAPCTKSFRKYVSPRLVMPSNCTRPPLDLWPGTSPSEVANWRPFLNACALPTVPRIAVAMTGPTPARRVSRRQTSDCVASPARLGLSGASCRLSSKHQEPSALIRETVDGTQLLSGLAGEPRYSPTRRAMIIASNMTPMTASNTDSIRATGLRATISPYPNVVSVVKLK